MAEDTDERVNLKVYPATRKRLNDEKDSGQSQDALINELLDEREQRQDISDAIEGQINSLYDQDGQGKQRYAQIEPEQIRPVVREEIERALGGNGNSY
jgi:hypothetical protein